MLRSSSGRGGIRATVDLSEVRDLLEKLRNFPSITGPVLKEVTETLRAEAVARSPVEAGWFREAWSQTLQLDELTYGFQNLSPYAYVLEEGKYVGVGPRTQTGEDGGIYSSQAVGGILRPLEEEYAEEIDIVELLINAIDQYLSKGN